jgi:excisionase family DNA binding protein
MHVSMRRQSFRPCSSVVTEGENTMQNINETIEAIVRRVVQEELSQFRESIISQMAEYANPDRFLSVKDAAALISVSESTIYRWIKEGQLRSTKLGVQHRIQMRQLLAVAENANDVDEAVHQRVSDIVRSLGA